LRALQLLELAGARALEQDLVALDADRVARQTDHSLDEVLGLVDRVAEHDHVAAGRGAHEFADHVVVNGIWIPYANLLTKMWSPDAASASCCRSGS
jgi:hypothetical protein